MARQPSASASRAAVRVRDPPRVPARRPGLRPPPPGLRRPCLRRRGVRPTGPQQPHVLGTLGALGPRRQARPRVVPRDHARRLGRAPAPGGLRGRGLPLRTPQPWHVSTPLAAVEEVREPADDGMADLHGAAAGSVTAARGLPDQLLRPVGEGNLGVLRGTRRPLESARTPRHRGLHRLLRGERTRRGRAHRPAPTVRAATAGDAVRTAVPP